MLFRSIIASAYMNQDFLGCAPVGENGVMYGFTDIDVEKVNIMGTTDINSYVRSYDHSASANKYRTADEMPYESRRVYSEIGIERTDTKPNCVVMFDDLEDEAKMNAYDAAAEFNIPIYYIDKKEIAEQQIERLQGKIADFKETKDINKLDEIINTYETNAAGFLLNRTKKEVDETHTSQIDNTVFKEQFDKVENEIYDSVTQHLEYISSKEDKNLLVSDIVKIKEIAEKEEALYSETMEQKPISKTESRFKNTEIKGLSEKILDQVDSVEYKDKGLSMKALVAGAIDEVKVKDIEEVDRIKMSREKEDEKTL